MPIEFKDIPLHPDVLARLKAAREIMEIALDGAPEPRPAVDDVFVQELFTAMPFDDATLDPSTAAARFAEQFETFAVMGFQLGSFRQGASPAIIARAFEGFCTSGDIMIRADGPGEGETLAGLPQEYVDFWRGLGEQKRWRFREQAERFVNACRELPEHILDAQAFSHIHALNAYVSLASAEDAVSVAILGQALLGEATEALVATIATAYGEWIFDTPENMIRDAGRRLQGAIKSGDREGTAQAITSIRSMMHAWGIKHGQFGQLTQVIRTLRDEGFLAQLSKERWTETLDHARYLFHDAANAFSPINGMADLLENYASSPSPMVEALLERLISWPGSSTLDQLVNAAIEKIRPEAHALNIALTTEIPAELFVQPAQRADLKRAVSELLFNARKNYDPSNPAPLIRVFATPRAGHVDLHFWDNGVGIRDVDNVRAPGVRERPDEVPGTGFGLSGIDFMARRNGWEFHLASNALPPHTWTEAIIAIPAVAFMAVP